MKDQNVLEKLISILALQPSPIKSLETSCQFKYYPDWSYDKISPYTFGFHGSSGYFSKHTHWAYNFTEAGNIDSVTFQNKRYTFKYSEEQIIRHTLGHNASSEEYQTYDLNSSPVKTSVNGKTTKEWKRIYDDQKRIVQFIELNSDPAIGCVRYDLYQYDGNGMLKEIIHKVDDETITGKTVFLYGNKNVTEKYYSIESSQEILTYEAEFDEFGIIMDTHYRKGKLHTISTYEYDGSGLISKITTKTHDKLVKTQDFKYTGFDSYNNWRKMVYTERRYSIESGQPEFSDTSDHYQKIRYWSQGFKYRIKHLLKTLVK